MYYKRCRSSGAAVELGQDTEKAVRGEVGTRVKGVLWRGGRGWGLGGGGKPQVEKEVCVCVGGGGGGGRIAWWWWW